MSTGASRTRRASRQHGLIVGLAAFLCAALVGTAVAAPASGGRHLPYFSLMNERVAIKTLPFTIRFAFRELGRARPGAPHAPKHGPVWFGRLERSGATIEAAGTRQWVCDFEEPNDEYDGESGACAPLSYLRQLDDLNVGSCNGSHRFRVHGLVPNGVTGLEIEKSDATITRTIPVVDNTFAFSIGHEDITLRGVGDHAAEHLERQLPLGGPSSSRGGCTSYAFAESAKPAK